MTSLLSGQSPREKKLQGRPFWDWGTSLGITKLFVLSFGYQGAVCSHFRRSIGSSRASHVGDTSICVRILPSTRHLTLHRVRTLTDRFAATHSFITSPNLQWTLTAVVLSVFNTLTVMVVKNEAPGFRCSTGFVQGYLARAQSTSSVSRSRRFAVRRS